MKQRIKTGFFIFLATALAILSKLLPLNVGDYIFDIFIITIAMVAGFEMCNIMEAMSKPTNKLFTFIYPIFYFCVLMICVNNHLPFALITMVEFAALLCYMLIVAVVEVVKTKAQNLKASLNITLNTLISSMYPGLWFCLLLNINHIDVFAGQYFSLIFIILIVVVTMLTDTFAYFVGSRLRGPKLAPSISPNKTISGAIGGLFGGIAGAMLLYLVAHFIPELSVVLGMHGIAWWHFLLLGLFGSIFGQMGDLFESKLKRLSGVKDSSNIFPGHGGMLDRIDAMIFVTIFIFLYVTIIIL